MEDWINGVRRSQSKYSRVTGGMIETPEMKLAKLKAILDQIQAAPPQIQQSGVQIAMATGKDIYLLFEITQGLPVMDAKSLAYFSFDPNNVLLWAVHTDTQYTTMIHVTKETLSSDLVKKQYLYKETGARLTGRATSEIKSLSLQTFQECLKVLF